MPRCFALAWLVPLPPIVSQLLPGRASSRLRAELEASLPARTHYLRFDLDARDVLAAQAAQAALRSSWCRGEPEKLPPAAQGRIKALYRFLSTKRMVVKVLPDEVFGLIHGKAGLIRYPDGRAITFLGSVNESATAWKLNYELLGRVAVPQKPSPG